MLDSNNQNTPRKDNFGSVIITKGSHKIKIDEMKNTEHDVVKSQDSFLVESKVQHLDFQDDMKYNEEVNQ